MKEKWKQPELIIIVKTRIEENVLAGCKLVGELPNPCREGPTANRPATS